MGETVTVAAGSDLVLDGAVGGKPEPSVHWSKGDKILELGEKYSLSYSSTRAMAVIKSCDRSDTGRYCLTVKNASGTKTAVVSVKVLGELSPSSAQMSRSCVTRNESLKRVVSRHSWAPCW